MHQAMRRRSAGIMRFFLQLAQAAPHLREESIEWLDRLEPEHDNVRAALDHFEQVGRDDHGARAVPAFWWFWSLRGPCEGGSSSARACDRGR